MDNYQVAEALCAIAKEWAKKLGYSLIREGIANPKKEAHHPLNRALNKKVPELRYNQKENITTDHPASIEVRQRFGTPRLDIYGINREWFVGIEVRDGQCNEAQVFYPKGFDMLPVIKKQIENRLKDIK